VKPHFVRRSAVAVCYVFSGFALDGAILSMLNGLLLPAIMNIGGMVAWVHFGNRVDATRKREEARLGRLGLPSGSTEN